MTEPVRSIPAIERTERQAALLADAADLAGDVTTSSSLAGYTILAFYSDGSTRTAGWRPNPDDHAIGSTMFEAWARSTLESHFSYGEGVRAAHDVLNGDS